MRKKELRERLASCQRQLKSAQEENIFLHQEALRRWEKENSIFYDFDNHVLKLEKWYSVLDLYRMEKQLRLNNAIARMYHPAIMMLDRRTLHVINDWILMYKGVEQEIEITSLSKTTHKPEGGADV